jgi:uncharacterized protein (DUF4415 family)
MSTKDKVIGTDEAWESGQLGTDEKHAHPVDAETAKQIDDALGLQMISIRLDKGLIESFKMLGAFHGLGYQPLMRDALKRFADAEMKSIVSGFVESQTKQQTHKRTSAKVTPPKIKKAA